MSPVTFTMPVQQAEEPSSGRGNDTFPEGTWLGTIEAVRVNEVHTGDKGDFLLTVGRKEPLTVSSAKVASVQLGQIEPVLDDQPEVGARKFFDEKIYLEMDGVSWADATDEQLETYWPLRRTRSRLTNLALSIEGAHTVEGDQVAPVADFDEIFVQTATTDEGELLGLAGARVIFVVSNNEYDFVNDAGERIKGVSDRLEKYQQAV